MGTEKEAKKRFNLMLDESTYNYLINAANDLDMSASELIRELINRLKNEQKQKVIREAAVTLYDAYKTDRELVSFSNLDSVDKNEH